MKLIAMISLLVINLVPCYSYSEEISRTNTVLDKELELTPNESINNNLKLEKIEDNCVATLKVNNKVVSEIYLAGSKQEEYFLPCVDINYIEAITTSYPTIYVFSLDQVAPDNRYFTITRILKLKNNRLIDDIEASNLINGCFVKNPVKDIESIKELMLHITELENQCDSNTQRLKLKKTIPLFSNKMKKTNRALSSSDYFYIINNKRFQGKTWYQIDDESDNKLWLKCNDINLC